ncbi:MAG: hypothetical protein KJ905_03795 [Nanoarchaeota archaeon]|nr:hypothetical protein [Nanoarchaeota archaeon]MBU1501864.1 hypothetical protein [Nanoarchaeota archaeon]
MNTIVHIFAKSPPAIAIAIGGVGMILGVAGMGWLVVAGIGLQVAWLAM